jgi:hypothetical protein
MGEPNLVVLGGAGCNREDRGKGQYGNNGKAAVFEHGNLPLALMSICRQVPSGAM